MNEFLNEFQQVWIKVGWFKLLLLISGFIYFELSKMGLAMSERYAKDRAFSLYTYWCKVRLAFLTNTILVVIACPLLIAEYNLKSWLAVFSLGATGGVVILTIIQIPLNLTKKK